MAIPDLDERNRRFHIAAGEVIRAWASYEGCLFFVFQALVGGEHFRLRIIWMTLQTYQSRRTMLRRLAECYLPDNQFREFNIIMKRSSKLARKRNLLAHASAGIDPDSGKAIFLGDEVDDDFGVNFYGRVDFELSNVENWPKDIKNLQDCLLSWIPKMQASILPCAKMHRAPPPDTEVP